MSLDTHAYDTDVLTMAVIDPLSEQIEFFSTSPDGRVHEVKPTILDRRQKPSSTDQLPSSSLPYVANAPSIAESSFASKLEDRILAKLQRKIKLS